MEERLNEEQSGARADLLARAEALYRDVELSAVRSWKAANPGARAIGFLPMYAPCELIHAAGALPVAVLGGGDIEIVKGDAYFQSYICHIPRSTVELGLSGALDCLDGMIFPSVCDVIRNLSGMWQILFPGKWVHYFDMPQNRDPALGGAFYAAELRAVLAELAALTGREATSADLRASIAVYDRNRHWVEELYRLRRLQPWNLPSSELYLLLRAGCVLPVEQHTALLRDYHAAAAAAPYRPQDLARVVVRGCFCEQPPLDLIRTLERSGCCVVDDDWVPAAHWFRGPVAGAGEPLECLVRAFLDHSPVCPSLYDAEGRRGAALVECVRACTAEGVVFMAPSFCDPALLDQPMTMAAVKAAGIPCTSFLYAENTGQFQTIREQAGTFADSIKLA